MKRFFKMLYLLMVVALFFYAGYLRGEEDKAGISHDLNPQQIVQAVTKVKDSITSPKKEKSLLKPEKVVAEKAKEEKVQEPKRIPVDQWTEVDHDISIPILMYHDLNQGNVYQMPINEFEHQMEMLKNEGYYFLTPEEAYTVLTERKQPQEKVIWVTFDDGYKSNLYQGLPVFQKLGLSVTINMVSGGGKSLMNDKELKELDNAKGCDVTIESHTVHHHDLDQMTAEDQWYEMVNSRDRLEKELNKKMDVIAYPEGKYNVNSITAARDAGYKMALTTLPGLANIDQGLYELHRIEAKPGLTDEQFMSLI